MNLKAVFDYIVSRDIEYSEMPKRRSFLEKRIADAESENIDPERGDIKKENSKISLKRNPELRAVSILT